MIALVISANQSGRHPPDAGAYLFACAFGALMLVRRRFPVAMLVVTMFVLFAYYALDYPAIGLAVPVAATLYSAAERGHVPAAIVIRVILVIVSTYFRLRGGQSVAFVLSYELVSTVALMGAAIALGDSACAAGYLLKDLSPEELRRAVHSVAGGEALLAPWITRRVMQQLAATSGKANPQLLADLTEREREILRHIDLGESNDEIARSLVISPATARTYVSRLLAKLNARDRSHLVIIAYESGLITSGQT